MFEKGSKPQERKNNNEDSDNIMENQILEEELILGEISKKHPYNKLINELNKIQNNIKNNKNKIEQIKKNLIKLKTKKNKQQKDIINLLSEKESIEEIYKNKMFSLNSKKKSKNNNQHQIFKINFEEFKSIEITEYIEEVLSMTEDILDNCGKQYNKDDMKNNLKKIINNSYQIYRNNSSMKDIDFIVDNFITKISLYISNQSFGKISEKDINIILRYLINIIVINQQITKMSKFVNKQYKETKVELKNEIKNLENKNEILLKLYNDGKEALENTKKNEENKNKLYLQNFNFNIKNQNTNKLKTENNEIKKNVIDREIIKITYSNMNTDKINTNISNELLKKEQISKSDKKQTVENSEKEINEDKNKDSSNNRVIKGKKIKRELFYHISKKNEKEINSEEDSFYKNVNCISDDESEENHNNKLSNNEEKRDNKIKDINEKNLLENKKKRLREIIDEIEKSEKINNKENNLGNRIYNKKSIKFNNSKNINKNYVNSKESKIMNNNKIEDNIKKIDEKKDIFLKKQIINNRINIGPNIIKTKNDLNLGQNNYIKNKNVNQIENSKNKKDELYSSNELANNKIDIINKKIRFNNNIINNRSFDSIFKNENKIKNNILDKNDKCKSPKISLKNILELKKKQNKKDIQDKKIYYNKKKKGVFSKCKINNNNNIQNKEKNDNNINSDLLQNLVKKIKMNLTKNNINENNNNNDKDINEEIKVNNKITENIINNLLVPKNNNQNINNNNLFNFLNNMNIKENSKNKKFNRFITNNEIISNNINNNNEITLPFSNQPISNKISKLNLNIFITQNKENNSGILDTNILSEPNIIRSPLNKENQEDYFVENGVDSDNIINGINREEILNSDDNMTSKEKSEINKNYKKLNLNKKIFKERNKILLNNKYFSMNTRHNRIRKINKTSSNINNEISNINAEKRLKSQYSLFYNTHDFSNNNYYDQSSKSKKKANKLLIKKISNSQTYNNKKQSENIQKYIDLSYLNQFNNSLMSSYNNNSYSISEEKINKGKKPLLLSNNIKKKVKNFKDILIETDNSENKDMIKNKNKKNQIIKLIQNRSGTFNQRFKTSETNINTISNTNKKVNKIFLFNKTNNQNRNKNNNNNLKKLLKNNLKSILPNKNLQFNPKKIFAEGVMESFCYFKILDKDSTKFNPLDSCTINPESLGYSEGYISIDVILGQFRIIPKNIMSKNFKTNNKNSVLMHNNSLSLAEYTVFNNGNNVFTFEIDKSEKKNCIRIDLKDINGVRIKKNMLDIIKIHKIFLKYNSNANFEYEDTNGRTKKRVLSINKLLYTKEISEINMDQNEKIKAALCNFFSFTILFSDSKYNKVECIFINYELFNVWNKCLEMIAENNNKSKNTIDSHRGFLHKKHNSNNYYVNK